VARSRAVFAPLVAALLLCGIGATFAVYAGRAGLAFLPHLNLKSPLLAQAPPKLGARGAPLARRVILIVVDGLSERSSYNLPLLDDLRSAGVHAIATAHTPTISMPNYVAMVTGVDPAASGVRNNFYPWPVHLDSIMVRLAAQGRGSVFVSDSSTGFPHMFSHVTTESTNAPWPGGFVQACQLAMTRDFGLVILLPGAVDAVGHLHGAASDRYRAVALDVDADLRRCLTPGRAESGGLGDLDLTTTTVIVTADHGHTQRGGHGGAERAVREVPLILAGAGVRKGAIIKNAELVDLAPTMAALLGVSAPGHALGRTLAEALLADAATAAALAAADSERRQEGLRVVAAERELARDKAVRKRAQRISLVVSGVALAIILLVLGARLGALHIDWRVLTIAVPAFPLAFYVLLEMLGQHFSLSALPDEGVGARRVFHFGLGSTAVHVLASWLALRGRVVLRDRLAAANAVTLCGLVVAALPAALAWAAYGGGPHVELPPVELLFLIPAMYIAISSYAIAAAVTLGLELVVFFARAIDPRRRAAAEHAGVQAEGVRDLSQ
jgi:hypothetical protein